MFSFLFGALVILSEVLTMPLSTNISIGFRSFSSLQTESANIIDSIASGTEMALHNCQYLFKWERWNCPKTVFTRQQRLLPTKELAFTKAIIAAGLAYSITKNCSKGQIEGCECDRGDKYPIQLFPKHLKNTNFENVLHKNNPSRSNRAKRFWAGCSDDIRLAFDITRKILNTLDKGLDPPAYVARHNYKIGIEVIQKTRVKKCRCHGISGSCSMQTCWMQIASFGEISKKIKDLYRKSVRVTYRDVQKSIVMGNSARVEYIEEKEIVGTKHSLIYLEQSPDYCLPNLSEGYLGTKGRTCSRNKLNTTKLEKNSCRNLCKKCGHRVKRLQKKVTRRCNCTFTWCCEVRCDTCLDVVNEYFCV